MSLVVAASEESVRSLLGRHPRVARVETVGLPGEGRLEIRGPRLRQVVLGDQPEIAGLIELMDNNPIVCADEVGVPDPVSTLALLALGPIAEAGLLVEAPTILTNVEADETTVARWLSRSGWTEGATLHTEPQDLDGCIAATVIAAIRTPSDLGEIDELYDERYSRSLFVRREEKAEWDIRLVKGHPWANYRLRIAPDEPHSLLTVLALADLQGKGGPAQTVHAMNIMLGFEESLGIL